MRIRLDQLLDRQIVDRDGRLVGKVDDIRLGSDNDGPYVEALLTGQVALAQRVGGWFGRLLSRAAERIGGRRSARPMEIPFHLVAEVGSAVKLHAAYQQLPEPLMESWLRRHLIERIPGAGRAGG